MELAAILGGVIDFALDPRRGDEIMILFEENFLDDEKYSDGNILAASFNNNGRLVEAFRFTDSYGDVGYYDSEGVSMRKAFLKAPLDFTRVSSALIQIGYIQSTRQNALTAALTTRRRVAHRFTLQATVESSKPGTAAPMVTTYSFSTARPTTLPPRPSTRSE